MGEQDKTKTANQQYGIVKRMIHLNRSENSDNFKYIADIISSINDKLTIQNNKSDLLYNKINALDESIFELKKAIKRIEYFIYDKYPSKFNGALKNRIRYRDGYICQECGITEYKLGGVLHIHHIDFDKSNNEPGNLIAVCPSCHAKKNKGVKWKR